MKKANKIINAILIGLLVSFGIYVLVSFIVNKDCTMYWINYVVDLLNKPLPIVGVTTAAILFFAWQVVIKTRFGQSALNNVQREYQSKYDTLEQKAKEIEIEKQELEKWKEENQDKINYVLECFEKLCATIPNKKVNELGKDFAKGLEYGKETIDSESKAD